MSEASSSIRSEYQRDRDRVVHSTAFRRLEGKTQVFTLAEHGQYRTRLTHSLEVAQITRTIARALRVDEDLAEAVALAHDLGHSPFGHAGERGLASALQTFGGFDHNLQTFSIVTALEQRYAAFDGLNLTIETLEGVVKHNGPLTGPVPEAIALHPLAQAVDLGQQPPLEAQIAAISDDVAYSNHDLDDGLRAGFFTLDELASIPIVGEVVGRARAACGAGPANRLPHETNRRLIDAMVSDLVAEARRRLAQLQPSSVEDIRRAAGPTIAFSAPMAEAVRALREFLRTRVYQHYKVNRMTRTTQALVHELVSTLIEAPECLPDAWRQRAGGPLTVETAAAVRDYVAAMTDRGAVDEHARLHQVDRRRP